MGAQNPSPLLFGTNSIARNLQNGEVLANGTLINSNGNTNYITNGTSTNGSLAGYALYVDAAGPAPVSGAGTGTNTITFTSSTTAPLAGDSSFLLTKPASNAQGQGVAYAFTINNSSTAKVLQITADMQIASGTFVAGGNGVVSDVTVYIVNTTTGVVTQPSTYTINTNSLTVPYQFNATFQTDNLTNGGTSYRLCFHVASTSTAAYALQLDNISVSPSTYVYGTPITDWAAYTPTFTGFGTVTGTAFRSRRVGDSLEVMGYFVTGTGTATINQISIGYNGNANITIDTTKVNATQLVGKAATASASTTYFGASVLAASQSTGTVTLGIQNSSTSELNGGLAGASFGNSTAIELFFQVPILGWSSSVQTSDQTDTRVISAAYSTLSSTTITAGTALRFTSLNYDRTASYSTSTGAYTVPTPGVYQISIASIYASSGGTDVNVYVNGSSRITRALSITIYGTVGNGVSLSLNGGDVVTLIPSSSTTAGDTLGNFAISRLSGPSAIAATESVNARYYAGTATIATTPSAVSYTNKDFDSHNGYASGVYTIPVSGKYQINASVDVGATFVANNIIDLYVYNGATIKTQSQVNTPASITLASTNLADIISCLAGDQITIKIASNATTPTLSASSTLVYFSISRVGN